MKYFYNYNNLTKINLHHFKPSFFNIGINKYLFLEFQSTMYFFNKKIVCVTTNWLLINFILNTNMNCIIYLRKTFIFYLLFVTLTILNNNVLDQEQSRGLISLGNVYKVLLFKIVLQVMYFVVYDELIKLDKIKNN